MKTENYELLKQFLSMYHCKLYRLLIKKIIVKYLTIIEVKFSIKYINKQIYSYGTLCYFLFTRFSHLKNI